MHINTLSGLTNGNDLEKQIESLVMGSARGELEQAQLGGFFKKLRKKLKKVVKKTVKVVKKVAPVAVAGAAIYYGGPYVVAGAKKLFGGAAPTVKSSGANITNAASSTITDKAMQTATALASKQGVNLNSSDAQNILRGYIQLQQAKIASKAQQVQPQAPQFMTPQAQQRYMDQRRYAVPPQAYRPPAPAPTTGIDMKTLLPLAAGIPLLIMAMK